ncbi:MAG TPA: hypothetical protein VKA10_00225, partial [Prolixibacteraceae bacterium]|nr:hypothetical protein [Prolixibacteraceae bacterium]
MRSFIIKTVLVFSYLSVISCYSFGNISIPEIFSSNMVLQQNAEVTFWGWAKSGETVQIKADWM